ncbi:MAG: hypothetical protein V3U21_04990, partial [Thermodesulfobacteriota bacterium]
LKITDIRAPASGFGSAPKIEGAVTEEKKKILPSQKLIEIKNKNFINVIILNDKIHVFLLILLLK